MKHGKNHVHRPEQEFIDLGKVVISANGFVARHCNLYNEIMLILKSDFSNEDKAMQLGRIVGREVEISSRVSSR